MKMRRTPIKKPINRTPVRKPLILVKKDPTDDIADYNKTMVESQQRAQKFVKDISTESGYIERLTETNLEPTTLYKYQKKWLDDRSKYRHSTKSRQIGQSYCFSCEGYSKCQLFNIYTGIFVSYTQSEANEKIVYAKTLHESVPHKYKKKMVIDRITALEFEGRTSNGRTTRTRIISHPQREPRGKGYNTDVFLDEIAHYTWPEKVYVASVPIVTRGFGQLSLASSPLGKSGLHWEIGTNTEVYSMFSRHKVYWWENPDFLNGDALRNIEYVKDQAPLMETQDRVLEFGNDAIVQAYYSMLIEDFMQEYEINPIDESVSYYPIELINQCTFEAFMGIAHTEEDDIYGDNPIYVGGLDKSTDFRTYDSIEELSHAIAIGKVGKQFFAGFDVGRDENNSEVVVIEELPQVRDLHIVRLLITMKRTEFKKQRAIIDKLFSMVPIKKFKGDETGMGKNICEDLKRKYRGRVENVTFNLENKREMATNLKIRMEDQSIALPNDRDLKRQIHSVKRVVSSNSAVKFEIEKNRLHHGDKFWALALASSAGKLAEMHGVRLFSSNLSKGVVGGERMLIAQTGRMFNTLPLGVGGVNFKKLPPPPSHNVFNLDSVEHRQILMP